MSQVIRTQLSCPACGQTFQAIIEQIVDVGSDPQAKARFLSGRLNMVTCPHCGHTLAVATPLLYHDPNKELLLIHVPMGLQLPTEERESIVGNMTRRLTDSIPPEKRKGYLLQPRQALTIPGMIDMILEADGITAEMREAQREKMRVMEMFLQVGPDGWPNLLQEQNAVIDEEFIQMVLVTAQNAAETGKGPMAEALMILYDFLIHNSAVGQQALQAAEVQENIVHEVAEELQKRGSALTREGFMDLVISYAGDDDRIQAVVGLMRPALDYQFFQQMTNRIDAAQGEQKNKLTALRDRLLDLTSLIDQQTQVVLQRAADTLRVIVNSEDIDAAIRPRLDMIDDTFLAVLQANIQAAEQQKDARTAGRLKEVLSKTLEILRESAPPQIRLINDIMSTADDAEARAIITEQAPRFGPELLELMDAVAEDLEENEQTDSAARLRTFKAVAAQHVGDQSQMPVPPSSTPPSPLLRN